MPDYALEAILLTQGFKYIAGVDEVGRGPWAGPVLAGAAILDIENVPKDLLLALDDSKKLKPIRREEINTRLLSEPSVMVGFGAASVEEVDEINILQASLLAMQRAVNDLPVPPSYALVDGNKPPKLECPLDCVVKGDAISLSIAAASIIAKVARDRLMTALDLEFPGYGWATNAGYGTPQHQAGIKKLGICPHHRKSFKPIKVALEAITRY